MIIPLRAPIQPAPAAEAALAAVRLEVLLAALHDAAEYRRDRAWGYCLYCACERHGLCPDHARDYDTADDYDELAETLTRHPACGLGWPADGAR